MKIAYLALSERFGAKHAGFVHTKNICENLAALGNKVELFILKGRGEPLEGVKVNFVSRKNLLKVYGLRKQLKKFDVIHERFFVNPYSLFLTKGLRVKKFLEMNDPGIETWRGMKRVFYAMLINAKVKNCNAIITQTETTKRILNERYEKQVFVVSNGVDFENFRVSAEESSAEREKYAKKDEKIVAFLGSFREWHGVLDVPEIAERILKIKPNAKFLMIGAGKELKKVKKIVDDKKISDSFVFLDGVTEGKIPLALSTSDVCIAPFSTKRFKQLMEHGFWWCPIKLFEYMAAGKAVVATDFPEVRNILGGAALYYEDGNLQECASSILQLLNDEKLAAELSAEGMKKAKQNTWQQKAKETMKVYCKFLK